MADNLAYTPGAGAIIKTDQDSGDGAHMQIVKLAYSGDGVSTLLGADANGLDVDVTRVSGNVTVVDGGGLLSVDDGGGVLSVDDGAGSLTVDAPVGAPVFVRLSDGAAALSALPVTDNGGNLSVDDGGGSLTVDGTVAATQSGAWNVGTVTTITNVVHVDDNASTISVDDGAGSLTVDGTVTANQGTAAAVGSAWPVKVSDGVSTVGITDVAGAKAIKVDVIQTVGQGAATDKSAFVEGTGKCDVAGAVFNDAIGSDPTEDQAAALRITAKRGLHANLRNAAGTEIGTAGAPVRVDPTGSTTQPVSGTVTATLDAATNAGKAAKTADYDTGAGTDTVTMFGLALPKSGGAVAGGTSADPIRVDPTGTTTQPVSGTVTANQGTANATPWNENLAQVGGSAVGTAAAGVQKVGVVDEAGTAYSHTNPVPVAVIPHEQSAQWRTAVTYAASETAIAIRTPTGGKKFAVLGLMISATATGVLKIFDNTNAAANMLFQGTPNGTAPGTHLVIMFPTPWISSAVDNVLRYSTGAGAAGDITVYGYEV